MGLPLAVAFAHKYRVIGFDINKARIAELQSGTDHTLEVSDQELAAVLDGSPHGLRVTDAPVELTAATVYIVTVPTPTDKYHRPVLTPLEKASETVGQVLEGLFLRPRLRHEVLAGLQVFARHRAGGA